MSEKKLYLGNVLNQFENGVQFDLRVKLAVELLKNKAVPEVVGSGDAAGSLVSRAFDMAEAIVQIADARGYLKDLPETDDLSAPMRKFIRMNVRAQVYQQAAAGLISQEEMPRVAAPSGNGAVLQG